MNSNIITTNPCIKNKLLAFLLFKQCENLTNFKTEVRAIGMTHQKRLREWRTKHFTTKWKKNPSTYIIFLSLSLNLSKSLNLPLPKQRESVLCVFLFPPFLLDRKQAKAQSGGDENHYCTATFYLTTSILTNCLKKNKNDNYKNHLDIVI